MIDVRLMQAAVTLAEELSFSRAALKLNISQSALSKQIVDLENRVGLALFERNHQTVVLTDAGRSFVEHARHALASAERAVHSARATALGADTLLSVGKSPFIDPYITSSMLALRLPLYPNLQLRFTSHFSPEAIRILLAGEVDLAIAIDVHQSARLSIFQIAEEYFFVAMPANHILARKEDVSLIDLAERRVVLPARNINPTVYDALQRTLSYEAVRPSELQHSVTAEEAASLILQRECIALLTQTSAWRISGERITVRPMRDGRLLLRTFIAARADDQSRVVSEFVRALMKRLHPVAPHMQGNLRLAV